jgi:hypothetical protein
MLRQWRRRAGQRMGRLAAALGGRRNEGRSVKPKHNSFLAHLLHRRCPRCHAEGFRDGFWKAAVEAERRERHLIELVQAGVDPWRMEETLRQRIAEGERAA